MNTSIVNPRLVDYFNLTFTQDDVDFIIPHLKEDLPLYPDPFLLWSSKVAAYRELHGQLLGFFDNVRSLVSSGRDLEAIEFLLRCQEPRELGLEYALGSKRGASLGRRLARNIAELF